MYDTISIINSKQLNNLQISANSAPIILAEFSKLLQLVAISDSNKSDEKKLLSPEDLQYHISMISQFTHLLLNTGALETVNRSE